MCICNEGAGTGCHWTRCPAGAWSIWRPPRETARCECHPGALIWTRCTGKSKVNDGMLRMHHRKIMACKYIYTTICTLQDDCPIITKNDPEVDRTREFQDFPVCFWSFLWTCSHAIDLIPRWVYMICKPVDISQMYGICWWYIICICPLTPTDRTG